MKLSLEFTYHYMIFLGMAVLLTPPKFFSFKKGMNEITIEKKQQIPAAVGNIVELLHGDIFFKY